MPVNSDNRKARSTEKTQTDLSAWVFWMLLVTGLTVLGVCMTAPAWIKCQMLGQQELALTRQLGQLRISSYHHAEAIAAAKQDVAFNERLLIEELNYHRPGEQTLPVAFEPRPSPATTGNTHTVNSNPAWLEAFAQPDTRNILLVMSTGLVLFAFVYYRPTQRTSRPVLPPAIPIRPARAEYSALATGSYLNR